MYFPIQAPEPLSQYRYLREVEPRRTAQKERLGGYGGGAGLRKNKPVPVRLVAFPVTEELANLHRMKAKKQSNGKHPSKKVPYLMGWSIFIATFSKNRMPPQTDRDAIRRTLADRKDIQTLEEQLLLRPHSQRLQPTTADAPACLARHGRTLSCTTTSLPLFQQSWLTGGEN